MGPSAILGQPPANDNDYWIFMGFARQAGIPTEKIDPSKGFPLPAKPTGPDPYNSHQSNIIAAMGVVIALIAIVTGLRIWLRLFRRDLRVGLDDLFMVISAFCAMAWFGLALAIAKYGGAGKHLYAVTYQEIYWFFRIAAISQVLFWPTVTLVNVSITLFNRRLTGLTSNRWQFAHYTFLVMLSIYLTLAFFLNLFICRPLTIQFSLINVGRSATEPKCLNFNDLGIALSAIHIAFQFSLLSVPLIILYIIKMSSAKKLRLGILFSVASLACIGAVMRQVLQKQGQPDITWAFQKQLAWTSVDLFMTTVAASLPVLNAAIPTRWRSPDSSVPRLKSLSILKGSNQRGSVKLSGQEMVSRSDGTVEEHPEVIEPEYGLFEKDSFIRKTERRWEEAFEVSRQSRPEVGAAY